MAFCVSPFAPASSISQITGPMLVLWSFGKRYDKRLDVRTPCASSGLVEDLRDFSSSTLFLKSRRSAAFVARRIAGRSKRQYEWSAWSENIKTKWHEENTKPLPHGHQKDYSVHFLKRSEAQSAMEYQQAAVEGIRM